MRRTLIAPLLLVATTASPARAAPFALARGGGNANDRIAAVDLASGDVVTDFVAHTGCTFSRHVAHDDDLLMATTELCPTKASSTRRNAYTWDTYAGTSTLVRTGTDAQLSLSVDRDELYLDGPSAGGWIHALGGGASSASTGVDMTTRPVFDRGGNLLWATTSSIWPYDDAMLFEYDRALNAFDMRAGFEHSRAVPAPTRLSPSERYVYFGTWSLDDEVAQPDRLQRFDRQLGELTAVDFVRDPGVYQRISGFDVTSDGRVAWVAFLPGSWCSDYELHRVDLATMTTTDVYVVGECVDAVKVVPGGNAYARVLLTVGGGDMLVFHPLDGSLEYVPTGLSDIDEIEVALALGCFADDDDDCDGIVDGDDLCPADADPDQLDNDGDGVGDACDPDDDDDGVLDGDDDCPLVPDPLQEDQDGDRSGDACDTCPFVYNPWQGPAPGVVVGFCVDERLLFDARFAGLAEVLVYDFGLDGPWKSAIGCPGECDAEIEEWMTAGRDAAGWYLAHGWDGKDFGFDDALAVMTTDSGIAEATAHERLAALEGWK